jgi:hypothetical protein
MHAARQMAPNLRGLFTKPKAIMAVKLVNIVGLLISISASPTTLVEIMRDVGVRHVIYGVAPHHLPVRRPRVCLTGPPARVCEASKGNGKSPNLVVAILSPSCPEAPERFECFRAGSLSRP